MLMSSSERPASLQYQANGFRVLSAGNFVLCAVTGERVLLDSLRYWSVARQEAYASAEIATRRLTGAA